MSSKEIEKRKKEKESTVCSMKSTVITEEKNLQKVQHFNHSWEKSFFIEAIKNNTNKFRSRNTLQSWLKGIFRVKLNDVYPDRIFASY